MSFCRREIQPAAAVRRRELGAGGRRGESGAPGGQPDPAGAQSHTPRHSEPQTGERFKDGRQQPMVTPNLPLVADYSITTRALHRIVIKSPLTPVSGYFTCVFVQ